MGDFLKNKVLPLLKSFLLSFTWVFIIMFALDIISKQCIMKSLSVGESVDLIPGFLRITYVQNFNAAFGIGFGEGETKKLISRILYIVIASIASAILIFFYIKKYKRINPFVKGCLMLILTGALGNLVDRIFYAPDFAVVDFIDFYFLPFWTFVFNIADCGVVLGALLLMGYIIFTEVKDYRQRSKEESISFSDKNNDKNQ